MWWILDSHRPLELHNLFSSREIIVVDDGANNPLIIGTIDPDLKSLRKAFEAVEAG